LFAVVLLSVLPLQALSGASSLLDSLGIEIRGASREFSYTNKQSAFYYGETNAENTSSWMGFNVMGEEFLDDYEVIVQGRVLERSSVLRTIVYPDYLIRFYRGGISETFRFADSIALFSVTIACSEPLDCRIIPYFTEGRRTSDYELIFKKATALVARHQHLKKASKTSLPVWLAIYGKGFLPLPTETTRGNQFSPLLFFADRARSHTLAFAVADQPDVAESTATNYIREEREYTTQRRNRMESLLRQTIVKTGDSRFDKALAWAKLSLDALIMNQGVVGIFAGLPWFNNYWGRDTFISLPGAVLVTGRFSEAKQILRSFATFQQADPTSPDYGRIPNIVTISDTAYNTADGTPRFVMMAKEYIERSGDSSFLREIYPTVRRATDGTILHHTDSLGFLIHGDAETWMDAVGPDGPWSPRGNRANDVQALWAQQLDAGIWFARYLHDDSVAAKWYHVRELLGRNFSSLYIRGDRIVDHLTASGAADGQIRPNQLFTAPLLADSQRANMVRVVTTRLAYEYGVASLSQDDENFHPYHNYPPYYPKDAAYHNGTVWTWLQGPLISELCSFGKQDLGFRVTENSVHQILDRGAVGTQSELLDAIHRPGELEPRTSGTFSQAWNLAEFIRNFYDDYLGVRLNLFERTLRLRPHVPAALGSVQSRINAGTGWLDVLVEQTPAGQILELDSRGLGMTLDASAEFITSSGEVVTTRFPLQQGSRLSCELKGVEVVLTSDGEHVEAWHTEKAQPSRYEELLRLNFAQPSIRPKLKSMTEPPYTLLRLRQIKAENPSAKTLVEADDPEGDDKGTGGFTYPENTHFAEGCFDLLHFRVRYDEANAYFSLRCRSLSNPGWHPEYGFQLTFAAIALDTTAGRGPGAFVVKHNANYELGAGHPYQRLILVGGGLQIEDASGGILAMYVPSELDMVNPLGNAPMGTIDFALPLSFLGNPSTSWRFVVLSGAQDDHGGAGLGEFRAVNGQASEWQGGGRRSPHDSNVYDTLTVSAQ
jgi:glycogen debranching enzyme